MATNTAALKAFAQQTRAKLISIIGTKIQYVLNADTAELRGYERQIEELRKQIQAKTEKIVVEEVAYTWFNRVMALRFMDANGYNAPMIVTPAAGQTRPEILQDAMAGIFDADLLLTPEEKQLPEAKLYRKLLVAVCNKKMSKPMPFLFEYISDYTELLLPDDLLSDHSFINDIRIGMIDEDCQNVELMGWLYQFYITDRKADAEAKKSKKSGLKSDEQAAATQLFTPHWIVRYMVENSLGRIWMTLHPDSHLIDSMSYYIPTPEGQKDTIPKDIHSARDIRFLDPCMGSGHILVYAFDLFTKMYEEEGKQTKDIPALILENNLYGIDIDRRCNQLASFALTMKARAYYRRYLRHTVNPNVIALEKIDHNTIDSAGAWGQKSLMWQFENIDTIGSLLKISPEECAAIKVEDGSLFSIQQKSMKTQAEYLSREYHCVVTNPPYLGKGFCDALKNYVWSQYPRSKSDTMAAFMERNFEFSVPNGKVAMINMQSWMSIAIYEKLREKILKDYQIDSLLHLGTGAFEEIGGEVVQSVTFVFSKHIPTEGIYFRLVDGGNCKEKEKMFLSRENIFYSVNQAKLYSIPDKVLGYWVSKPILDCFANDNISNFAETRLGMATADNNLFLRSCWEVSYDELCLDCASTTESKLRSQKWYPYAKGGETRKWYGNTEFVVNWFNNGYDIQHFTDEKGKVRSHNYNLDYIFKEGVTWNALSTGNTSFRVMKSSLFDNSGSSLFCRDAKNYYYLLGLLNSIIPTVIYPIFNQTYNYQPGTIDKLPVIVDDENKKNIENLVKLNISISKQDWDSHETSWDFKRNPLWEQQLDTILYDMQERGVLSEDATIDDIGPFNLPDLLQPLEILVKNYKSEWEDHLHTLHHNEEELNRKFIEIYGLQGELTPDVHLDEVTILRKGEISIEDNRIVWHDDVIIKQFISWLVGCFMGRFSVDKPGLILASQGQTVEDLNLPAHTIEIDDDGIIPVIMEEDFFTDDLTQRIESAVRTLYGEKYFYDNLKFIKTAIGKDLRDYIYNDFYNEHLQLYFVKLNNANAKRPIYWLFSSQMGDKKKKGYFKALVYMHRLEADTLSKLHADYVHPYLQKIEQQLVEAEDNAMRDNLSSKQKKNALNLVETLRDKVREVKAFESQLVEMASARITIDLDDGVKVNYPKFYPLVEPIKGINKSNDD